MCEDCNCSEPTNLEYRVETLERLEDVRELTKRYSLSEREALQLQGIKDPTARCLAVMGMDVARKRGFDEGLQTTWSYYSPPQNNTQRDYLGWAILGSAIGLFFICLLSSYFFG